MREEGRSRNPAACPARPAGPRPPLSGEQKGDLRLKKGAGEAYVDDVEAQATLLMTATKNGDRAAFDELTRTVRKRAFFVARSLVGSHDDAMELTQEALLKTFRARDTYRDGEPFLPWFHRILRNTCFSFLRKRKRVRSTSLSATDPEEGDWDIADDEAPPETGLERTEAQAAFWQGFRRLSARDREIIALRHFQELTYKEIATTLDIPEGTVMSRLFHARKRLREHLEPHLEGALEDYAPPPEESPSAPGGRP